ncbi:sulfotransferase domain-containing protein [Octadecabacter sp. R77987]|uniref:sulfotransferase domain-containing protein n=1 Tax=Octadecabacter sp. R77987 TaxID=3093874 RepID=UPI00366F8AB3
MFKLIERHPVLVRSLWRRVHQRVNPLMFQAINVNEFPKSGGTWLCRMLSDCLDWRFDDNTYPWFGNAIIKHHRLSLAAPRQITVVRDPRDVAESYFHHCRRTFQGDGFNSPAVNLMNKHVFAGAETEAAARDRFIERMVTDPIVPAYTWGGFYRDPSREGTLIVRYEDLREDTVAALTGIFDGLGLAVPADRLRRVAAAHDINKILKQRTGKDGAHFVRKGKVGGWQDVLSAKQAALVEKDAGALLDRFGYA